MNLKQLSVKNFKCFNDAKMEFSKLNIFTGKNSSGKSSILDALLAVVQSGGNFPFQLSPNGKYVVMGDYYEFVRNHDLNKPIEIRVVFQYGKELIELLTTWVSDESTKMPTLNTLEAKSKFMQLSISKHRNYRVHIYFDREKYRKSGDYKGARLVSTFIKKLTGGKMLKDYEKEFGHISVQTTNNTIDFQVNSLDDISGILTKEHFEYADYVLMTIRRATQQFDSGFNYIGSFRMGPERTYTQRLVTELIKPDGDYTIDQIFEWRVNKSQDFKKLIGELRNLQLINSLTITKFRGGRYEVRVKTDKFGAWASLVDVGFGISQFLPVIVADLQLPKGSTIMIAQPEIHLHPSAQAQLADYFVRQINNNNKKYFIETHSEYILNRLRGAIVKGVLTPSSVKVFYFENRGEDVDIHEIKFTKDGRILNAPQGFFDTYMIDIMDIAVNAAGIK